MQGDSQLLQLFLLPPLLLLGLGPGPAAAPHQTDENREEDEQQDPDGGKDGNVLEMGKVKFHCAYYPCQLCPRLSVCWVGKI